MQTLIPHWHTRLKRAEAGRGYINSSITDGQMVGLMPALHWDHFTLDPTELCWD